MATMDPDDEINEMLDTLEALLDGVHLNAATATEGRRGSGAKAPNRLVRCAHQTVHHNRAAAPSHGCRLTVTPGEGA